MPLHGYTTDRRPPTNRDHVLAHPHSFVLAAWQMLAGAGVLASLLWGFSLSQSINRMPDEIVAGICVLLMGGGIFIIRGLLDDSDDLMVGWKIERTGLVLSATAWAAYAATLAWSFPSSTLSWSLPLALTLMHLIRYRATVLEERRVRARIAEHPPT